MNKRGLIRLLSAAVMGILLVGCGGGYGGGGGNGGGGGSGSAPAAPSGLTATAGNAQVTLNWTASTGATGYNVKRSTTSGGTYSQAGNSTVTNFTDTGRTNGTKYYYVVSATNVYGESANSTEVSATPTAPGTQVTVNVDPLGNRHSINPNIYGGSFPKDVNTITDSGMTVVRWGGNATTRYNWVNFDTNAANDFFFANRTFLLPNSSNGSDPNLNTDSKLFVTNAAAAGGFPLMTIGMLPWVAKDSTNYSFSVVKYGSQCQVNPFNADAGNGVKPTANCATNPTSFVTGNDPRDAHAPLRDDPAGGDPVGTVYRHPWVTALATAFNNAGVPHLYNMDNETDIWGGTHRDVHPNPSTYNELRDTYLTEARAVRNWDSAAIRLGPVSCCWFFYWKSAAGNSETQNHGGVEFLPWWLNEVYWKDVVDGTQSLDIFDIHAYPGVPDTSSFTTAQKQAAILRVYRDWWDPTYVSEASDINQNFASAVQPVKINASRIPRMRALLNMAYPVTPRAQFSITEWNVLNVLSGGANNEADFSFALADAEAYGILGRERVDLSTRWTVPDPSNPNYQTLKLYRKYDGTSGHGFGPISISATHNADPNLFSTFAAINPAGNLMTLMVVNKDPLNAAQVTFNLNGFTPNTFTSYTLSQASPTVIVSSAANQAWPNGTQTFAAYSATLLVINGVLAKVPAAEWDLNPDTIQAPANGTVTLAPKLTSTSGTVTLTSAQFDNFYTGGAGLAGGGGSTISITNANIATALNGTVQVTAAGTPGFYHFTVTGQDASGAIQTQGGWIVVANPAATLAKTGDNQSALNGTNITLSVTLNPGASGGALNGASILFTTDSGNFGGASKKIVTTDGSGVAAVNLTLPGSPGAVHVTAEGPYGLGHPVVNFTETAQ